MCGRHDHIGSWAVAFYFCLNCNVTFVCEHAMGLKIIIITVINGHNLRELKLMTLFLRDENLDIFVFQVIDAFMQLLIHDTTGLCAFSSDVAQRMLVDGKSASEIIPWLRNDAENAQRLV